MNATTLDRMPVWRLATICLAALLIAGAATASDVGETRSSATSQGKGIARGELTDGAISYDEHAALQTDGKRTRPNRSHVARKPGGSAKQAGPGDTPNVEFWIYDASVALFSDLDGDGYYFGIDLNFDADTVYTDADVYAVVYLSYELGPWNEYAETDVFAIYGATGDDQYTIETELVSGYPTGDYDILIELFDAWDDSFVASFGPDESSALSFLPLEDAGRDTPPETTIVVTSGSGGGGAFGLIALLTLVAAAHRRD